MIDRVCMVLTNCASNAAATIMKMTYGFHASRIELRYLMSTL